MKKTLLFFVFTLIISFIGIDVKASDSLPLLPLKVKYGVYIKRITPNFRDKTFTAEFYWWVKFKNDTALTGISNDDIMNLEYANGVNNAPGAIAAEVFETREVAPNEIYSWGFHQGDFHFNPDFRKYPFDVQTLEILLENTVLEIDKLKFEPDTASFIFSKQKKDKWMLSPEMLKNKNLSYNIFKTEINPSSEFYKTNFGDPTLPTKTEYGRISIITSINRSIVPFFSKLIFPLVIILFLVYFVFFLPPEKIDIAAGLTVTSLLSSIAFQSSISSNLPDIGYIIFVDKLFYICYSLIAIAMAESLVTFFLDRTGLPDKVIKAKRIDFYSRVIFPVLFIVSLLLIL